jgi:alpha-glucosidase (family GH31 glycosyl hydrolase)
MNEPSVFGQEQGTMPLQNQHTLSDGQIIKHRDIHNAYGALQHRATNQGLYNRDKKSKRPFVLSRSFFIGSQKFGAFWTGDNVASTHEVQGSLY